MSLDSDEREQAITILELLQNERERFVIFRRRDARWDAPINMTDQLITLYSELLTTNQDETLSQIKTLENQRIQEINAIES